MLRRWLWFLLMHIMFQMKWETSLFVLAFNLWGNSNLTMCHKRATSSGCTIYQALNVHIWFSLVPCRSCNELLSVLIIIFSKVQQKLLCLYGTRVHKNEAFKHSYYVYLETLKKMCEFNSTKIKIDSKLTYAWHHSASTFKSAKPAALKGSS